MKCDICPNKFRCVIDGFEFHIHQYYDTRPNGKIKRAISWVDCSIGDMIRRNQSTEDIKYFLLLQWSD
jgi:hypothetical protein